MVGGGQHFLHNLAHYKFPEAALHACASPTETQNPNKQCVSPVKMHNMCLCDFALLNHKHSTRQLYFEIVAKPVTVHTAIATKQLHQPAVEEERSQASRAGLLSIAVYDIYVDYTRSVSRYGDLNPSGIRLTLYISIQKFQWH